MLNILQDIKSRAIVQPFKFYRRQLAFVRHGIVVGCRGFRFTRRFIFWLLHGRRRAHYSHIRFSACERSSRRQRYTLEPTISAHALTAYFTGYCGRVLFLKQFSVTVGTIGFLSRCATASLCRFTFLDYHELSDYRVAIFA